MSRLNELRILEKRVGVFTHPSWMMDYSINITIQVATNVNILINQNFRHSIFDLCCQFVLLNNYLASEKKSCYLEDILSCSFSKKEQNLKKFETTSIIKPGVLEIIGASVRDMFRSLASTAGYLYVPNHEEFFPWPVVFGRWDSNNTRFLFYFLILFMTKYLQKMNGENP